MKVYQYIFLWCFVMPFSSIAQDGASWQVAGFVGKNVTHTRVRTAPETIPHLGISIDYNKKTTGKGYWQYAHGYPQMGLQFTMRTLGNNRVYGYAFTLLPYLEFDTWRTAWGILQIKHGSGLAYVTQRYDPVMNPEAIVLSSRLAATTMVDVGYRFILSKHWDGKAGIVLHHISNGGFKLPNYGFNTLSFYAGLSYYAGKREMEIADHPPFRHFKRMHIRTQFSLGLYNYQRERNSINVNPQLALLGVYQHNSRFRTGLGLELGKPRQYRIQPAVYLEEEVQFSNIATRYGFGVYLANKRFAGEDFYSKIGMAYYPYFKGVIPSGFFIGANLKAHRYTAAHVELTAGFHF